MSTYNEGDLVEAVKGEQLIRGRVDPNGNEPGIAIGLGFSWLSNLIRDGFTVTVIERATPPLPTEPGIYVDRIGQQWALRANEHGSGEWFLGGVYYGDRSALTSAPFTRMEPAHETAKRVIEFIAGSWEFGAPAIVANALDMAAKEFGVTK